MKPLTNEQRQAVVAEAKTWIGTPYHHHGRVKMAGTDCAMLLAEVYAAAGVIQPVTVDHYPPDWHLHRDTERYLSELFKYGYEIEGPPQPADVLTVKYGHTFSHGAIVIEWPICIHAMLRHKVGYTDAERDQFFFDNAGKRRDRRFFAVGVE